VHLLEKYSKEGHILDADTLKGIFGVPGNFTVTLVMRMQKQYCSMFVISDFNKPG
jgi:hypothetical protein